ncbi:Putative zinc metalloprotease Rip3 [bacterium HR26]|nr:Putative zinc metalloprotease Rip3 [bacterium HR26]
MNSLLTLQVRLRWVRLRIPLLHVVVSAAIAGLISAVGREFQPQALPWPWWLVTCWLVTSWAVALAVHIAGHIVAARLAGDDVYRCAIWIFGDAPDSYRLPLPPAQETAVSLAGPTASLLLGGLGASLWLWTGASSFSPGLALLGLAVASLMLGLVNLLPGQPLDGGRILTALLLYLHGSSTGAWKVTLAFGRLMALFLLGLALMLLQAHPAAAIPGLWLGWLGWSLGRALRWEGLRLMTATVGRTKPASSLIGVQARVQADQPISEIAETLLASDRSPLALVLDGDAVIGVLATDQLVPALRRRVCESARRVMVPIERLPQVSGQEPVVCAFELLLDSGAPAILVTEGQRIIGALALGSLSKLLRLQQSAHSTAVADNSG